MYTVTSLMVKCNCSYILCICSTVMSNLIICSPFVAEGSQVCERCLLNDLKQAETWDLRDDSILGALGALEV